MQEAKATEVCSIALPQRLFSRQDFISLDQFDTGLPKMDLRASFMMMSQFSAAWKTWQGGQVGHSSQLWECC